MSQQTVGVGGFEIVTDRIDARRVGALDRGSAGGCIETATIVSKWRRTVSI
jgi:hypothetical protein